MDNDLIKIEIAFPQAKDQLLIFRVNGSKWFSEHDIDDPAVWDILDIAVITSKRLEKWVNQHSETN